MQHKSTFPTCWQHNFLALSTIYFFPYKLSFFSDRNSFYPLFLLTFFSCFFFSLQIMLFSPILFIFTKVLCVIIIVNLTSFLNFCFHSYFQTICPSSPYLVIWICLPHLKGENRRDKS